MFELLIMEKKCVKSMRNNNKTYAKQMIILFLRSAREEKYTEYKLRG